MDEFEEIVNTMKFRGSFLGCNYLADYGVPLYFSKAKKVSILCLYLNAFVSIGSLLYGFYEYRDSLATIVNLSKLQNPKLIAPFERGRILNISFD